MSTTKTTSTGSTITLRDDEHNGQLVILDHPEAPSDMRDLEAGRVIDGGFQPAPFAAFALSPEALRAIADLIEEAPR